MPGHGQPSAGPGVVADSFGTRGTLLERAKNRSFQSRLRKPVRYWAVTAWSGAFGSFLHFHATVHPTSEWIVQQLREAFSRPCFYRYVIFDHDAKFSSAIREFLTSSGIKPIQTSIYSPWQNGIAERWVGSCRRELLDHVIPLNEEHLRRLGREFLAHYHEDQTHNGLGEKTPADRPDRGAPKSEE